MQQALRLVYKELAEEWKADMAVREPWVKNHDRRIRSVACIFSRAARRQKPPKWCDNIINGDGSETIEKTADANALAGAEAAATDAEALAGDKAAAKVAKPAAGAIASGTVAKKPAAAAEETKTKGKGKAKAGEADALKKKRYYVGWNHELNLPERKVIGDGPEAPLELGLPPELPAEEANDLDPYLGRWSDGSVHPVAERTWGVHKRAARS